MRLLLFTILALIVCGCSPEKEPTGSPRKILSLSAAAAGILTKLGVPPTAIDSYSEIAAGSPCPPVIGKGSAVSREKPTEFGIDCVILWSYQEDAATLFRKAGLRVETLPQLRLETYPDLVRKLGNLTGKHAEAEAICRKFESFCSCIELQKQEIPVYFELYAPWKSAGRESYIGDLLRASGGVPISRKTGLISTETLLSFQPEVIFFAEGETTPEQIAKRPGFSGIPAVKNGRIYSVPRRLITEGLAPEEAVDYFRTHLNRSL
jgi:iron complex transport system substrate-binding protein